ncbi:MAG: hypothetical protein U9O56_06940 [Campylobacterota bacterium]|nr:hypothetical protein [Campylobacterota bacterium]
MFEKQEIKVFRTTIKKVVNNLSTIKDCDISDFKDEIEDMFDGYEYEDQDEIVGYDKWPDISKDGEYELNLKVDHENAYELTLYITTKDNKITVNNVL